MKKRVQVYVHRNKEDNWGLAEKLGFTEGSEAEKSFNYLGYETALLFEVNTLTGESVLIGADGRFLSDENITSGDIEVTE